MHLIKLNCGAGAPEMASVFMISKGLILFTSSSLREEKSNRGLQSIRSAVHWQEDGIVGRDRHIGLEDVCTHWDDRDKLGARWQNQLCQSKNMKKPAVMAGRNC